MSFRLYLLQRFTAALMLPLIVAHLATILYATRHGVAGLMLAVLGLRAVYAVVA